MEESRPILRVISGNPSPAEVAALAAVVQNLARSEEEARGPRNDWGNLDERLRPQLTYNAAAFRNVHYY